MFDSSLKVGPDWHASHFPRKKFLEVEINYEVYFH